MSNANNRVVVTGIGVVCPLGLNAVATWEALIAGRPGVDRITLFDTEGFETKIAGEVKGFDPTNYMNHKDARRNDRFSQMAVAASLEAVKHSGLQIDAVNKNDIGIVIGSGIGGLTTLFEQIKVLLERGADRVSPFLIPMIMPNIAAAQISIILGVKGPNLCTTSACSSGSDAIGFACETIKRGDAKVMVTGGSEAIINPVGVSAFNAMKAISTRNDEPQLASRPFDAERDGFVIGEGSGVLILEDLAFARARGAKILAELLAYGSSADAYHITAPIESGAGAALAVQRALDKAGIKPDEIDYINAHGTSTILNDKMETKAIKTIFGERAYKIPISSTKSMMGHLVGSAGAVEAAICIMAIRNGIIPPTINLTHPDPECDLDYVPNVARQAKVTTALSNSFGFGGHNSVLVFREYPER
ncbi:MAG: beta-ketoacyl-ACP synthase II [Deltaproteobacteria bacterium]|nr:beta-ketoacyl-ACP synthase II [Deltaproteobacteria bacterium]